MANWRTLVMLVAFALFLMKTGSVE